MLRVINRYKKFFLCIVVISMLFNVASMLFITRSSIAVAEEDPDMLPGKNYIINGDFLSELEGWIVNKGDYGEDFRIDGAWGPNDEPGSLSFWNDEEYIVDLCQMVMPLPNGEYEVSAQFYSDSVKNEAYMYAKDFGGEEIRIGFNEVTSDWIKISGNIIVTNGMATIGFYVDANAGQWVSIGDVSLTLIKAASPGDDPDIPPVDNPVLNYDFSSGLDNWTNIGSEESAYIGPNGHNDDAALSHWSASKYTVSTEQTITGLENGYYTLTAYVQRGGEQKACYLYANNFGNTGAKASLPVSDTWTKVVLNGLEVTNGQITIGLHSDSNANDWARIDSVVLEKIDKPFTLLKGGDLTYVNFIEDMGGKYYDEDGVERDVFHILAENGFNIARLRVYNDPCPENYPESSPEYYLPAGYQNKEDMLILAKRAKDVGMQILVSLHYSDWWSNGGVQEIPHEWQDQIEGLNEEQAVEKLAELVYEYTLEVMQDLAAQGTVPEFVSLGNEIQSGILFPYGRTTRWDNLAKFINAGYEAVKEVSPDTKVVLHLDDAGNSSKYIGFFDNCQAHGANYDVIGSSYYPFWTRKNVEEVVPWFNLIGARYDKPIMIMETGYKWNPTLPNGEPGQLTDNGNESHPASPQGQKDFMIELFNGIRNVEDNYVIGDLYWDPIMIEHDGVGWAMKFGDPERGIPDQADANVVSNTTLFDFNGKALPVLDAYRYNTEGSTQGMVEGKVIGKSGEKIVGAQVEIEVGEKTYTATTGRYGTFFIPNVPEGTNYTITATKKGYDSGTSTIAQVNATEVTRGIIIQITGGAVSGTVKDEKGNNVEGATVSTTIGGTVYSTKTDADGRYILNDLPEGTGYEIIAEKIGYKGDIAKDVTVTIDSVTPNVDLQIELNSGSIEGTVVDESGNPISGVTVGVVGSDGRTYSAITEEDGVYKIDHVPAEENLTITAERAGYVTNSVDNISVRVGDITTGVDIVLKENVGILAGKVLDPYGEPVSGVEVEISSYDNTYTTTTNESGEFRIEKVAAGPYTVTATSIDYMDAKENTTVVLEETTEITLRLLIPIEIKNNSFEDGLEGWEIIISEPEGAVFNQDRRGFGDDAPHGYYALSFWADVDYETEINQTIKDLPNGDYVLYALIYNGGEQNENYMYAKDSTNTYKVDLPPSDWWRKIELPFTVNEGEITIGFYNDSNKGNWMVVDMIEIGLIKVEDLDQDPIEDPGEEPGEDSSDDPIEDPDEDPIEDPDEEPGEDSDDDPTEEPGEDPGETPSEDPSEDSDEDADDKSPKTGDSPATLYILLATALISGTILLNRKKILGRITKI